jgi:hypothetical protein
MDQKFITFTKKAGKIQTGEIDPASLDVAIGKANQAYLNNEVIISDGLINRQVLKDELNKLIAVKEQLPN